MQKKIGNVTLDYTYYKGQDLYSDGEIEDVLLEIVKDNRQEQALYSSSQWPILYYLSNIREHILEWYPFCESANVLEIGSGCGAVTEILSKKVKQVTCIELSEKRSLINAYRNAQCNNIEILLGNFQDIEIKEKYDYITLIGVWEYAALYVNGTNPHVKMLEKIKNYLKPDGKIMIAIENKMGLKYWNGAPEDHTSTLYSGINDYIDDRQVRTFSKQELEDILQSVGLSKFTFYYPMPDYKLPESIYSDQFLPYPGVERNYGKDYNACRIYNFNDAVVTDQICNDNMFSYFANSFLVIVGENNIPVKYTRYNNCRKKEFDIKTELFTKNNTKYIRKRALHKCAEKHIERIKENEDNCKNSLPNIHYTEGCIYKNDYITPFIEGIDLNTIFYKYRHNPDLFIEKYLSFVEKYLIPLDKDLFPFEVSRQFTDIFGTQFPVNQMSLHYTNIDMIFTNLKLTSKGDLYCFDYEWVFDFPIPYEYVLWRSASRLYIQYMPYLLNSIKKESFFIKCGIFKDNLIIYENMDKYFYEYIYGKNHSEDYLKNYQKGAIRQSIRVV